MGDLIFVAVVVAFFALTAAYVSGCERIVGRAPALDAGPPERRASIVLRMQSSLSAERARSRSSLSRCLGLSLVNPPRRSISVPIEDEDASARAGAVR